MQNAPLWIQHERPGTSQGIDHWHDLLLTTSFTWIRTCSTQQIWQIWFQVEKDQRTRKHHHLFHTSDIHLALWLVNHNIHCRGPPSLETTLNNWRNSASSRQFLGWSWIFSCKKAILVANPGSNIFGTLTLLELELPPLLAPDLLSNWYSYCISLVNAWSATMALWIQNETSRAT